MKLVQGVTTLVLTLRIEQKMDSLALCGPS